MLEIALFRHVVCYKQKEKRIRMYTLFKFFVVIYIIYRVSRYLARTYFMSYMGKVNQQMNDQAQKQYQQQQRQQRRSDGNVIIDYIPNQKNDSKKQKSTDGDYVDYIEIK